MNLGDFFEEVGTEMRAQLRKARVALIHPGQKGDATEEAFREFLRSYLPNSLSVSTGRLIDSGGDGSKQLDVIIADEFRTPVFFRGGGVQVIPVECAYAVIEVKTNFRTADVPSVLENMLSVRALVKSAYYREEGVLRRQHALYGKQYEIWPVSYFVFAYESDELEDLRVAIEMAHLERQLPCESRIDCVCSLDKGVLLNWDANTEQASALPAPGTQMRSVPTDRGLLLFFTLISHYLLQATLPPFRLRDYLGNMRFSGISE